LDVVVDYAWVNVSAARISCLLCRSCLAADDLSQVLDVHVQAFLLVCVGTLRKGFVVVVLVSLW